jgi:hypothetical protein
MDANFEKVVKVLAEAGITPLEVASIICPQMHDIMIELFGRGHDLNTLLYEAERCEDEDELLEVVEQLKCKEK